MRREGERSKAALHRVDRQFLMQFPDQGGFGCFPVMDLAAGEFPQAGHALALRPLRQQHTAVGVDQRHGRDQQNGHSAHGALPPSR